MCDTRKDGGTCLRWASGDKEGVINGRASRAVDGSKRVARGLEGLGVKMAQADADHAELQGTYGGEGLGERGTERMKGNRGAHEEGILKAG